MNTSFLSSRRRGRGVFIALGLALGLAATQVASTPAPAESDLDEADSRLDKVLTLPRGKAIPPALMFSQLANEAKLSVVAVNDAVTESIQVPKEPVTARDALRILAKSLEGRWQREGETFVLGPPEGFDRIARLTHLERGRYSLEHWKKIVGSLRPAEWKRLRTRKPVDYREIRPALRPSVLELARLRYWINRHAIDPLRQVKLEWLEKEQLQLELPLAADGTGTELLVVGICPAAGQSAVEWERFRLR